MSLVLVEVGKSIRNAAVSKQMPFFSCRGKWAFRFFDGIFQRGNDLIGVDKGETYV